MATPRIKFFPLRDTLKKYSFTSLRIDLLAALSVALLALPQAIAYAFVAGLPPSTGIWAAIFGTIFTSSFGKSRYLVSGPTNVMAILIESGTSEILYTQYRQLTFAERELAAFDILLQIVLLVGIFQILAAFIRAGHVIRFTSRSVIIGYIAGAALAIIIVQLFPFLGIQRREGYGSLVRQAYFLTSHLDLLHLPTAILGLVTLVCLISLSRISLRIPVPALIIFATALFVYFFHLSPEEAKGSFEIAQGEKIEKITLLEEGGPIYRELPRLRLPKIRTEILAKSMPLAFAIALLGALEATSIGRIYLKPKDPSYQDDQEIFGLGISNFLSSFLGALPSSGSFSRSALNFALGAKSRMSAIFSGIFVFLYVVLIGFLIGKIPLCALSALMLFSAYRMVDLKQLFICLKTTRADAVVLLMTFGASLFFPLDVALYIGVILSIILYFKQAAVPELVEYAFNKQGKLRPLEKNEKSLDPAICILQVEGELFFGAAEILQKKIREVAEEDQIQAIILQLLNTRRLDASVCLALLQIAAYMKVTKRQLFISGVTKEIRQVLERSGLLKEIGEENCFLLNEQLPSESTRRAYFAAKKSFAQVT